MEAIVNPAFVIIIVVAAVAFWFCISSMYEPIGWIIKKIGKDAIDKMTKEDNKVDEEGDEI